MMKQSAFFYFQGIFPYQLSVYSQLTAQNQLPLVQFAYIYPNHQYFYPDSLQIQKSQPRNSIGQTTTKDDKTIDNYETKYKNCISTQEIQKNYCNVEKLQKNKKSHYNDLQYYDPHQAPALTFGIQDIKVQCFKDSPLFLPFLPNSNSNLKMQEDQQKSNIAKKSLESHWQFQIKEPNPHHSPFLIIKNRPQKRRVLSLTQYQIRAKQIQKRRTKNLQRLEIEQRIGKKLPIKNKKWQRKKQSLVFNATQFKKKIINSKKFKQSNANYEGLFTLGQ